MATNETTEQVILQNLQKGQKVKKAAVKLEQKCENDSILRTQKLTSAKSRNTFQYPQAQSQNKAASMIVDKPFLTLPNKIKSECKIPLGCFINKPNKVVKQKDVRQVYTGNLLDSDHPVRNSGKHREIPKKKAPSKLKADILKQECQRNVNSSKIMYCDNLITNDLNQTAANFLKKLVTFQENAFKKDSEKAKIKKRYIVGFHETKKYLLAKKVKFLIIASDMRIYNEDELLYRDIVEMKRIAIDNNIPYIFALKRSKIGNLTLKHRPVGCVGILNYQSAEAELRCIFNNLIKLEDNVNVPDEDERVNRELLGKLKEAILECDENK